MQIPLDPVEEQALTARFGPTERRQAEFELDDTGFRYWINATVIRRRRAEVVMIAQRPDGRVLLHTKSHHPPGTYRLLTGGVQWDEGVLDALDREQQEELSARLPIAAMPGIVRYAFRYAGHAISYASYLFLLRTDADMRPVVRDASEAISNFRWVDPGEIPAVVEQLRAAPHVWAGWGPFRAEPHDLLAELWKL